MRWLTLRHPLAQRLISEISSDNCRLPLYDTAFVWAELAAQTAMVHTIVFRGTPCTASQALHRWFSSHRRTAAPALSTITCGLADLRGPPQVLVRGDAIRVAIVPPPAPHPPGGPNPRTGLPLQVGPGRRVHVRLGPTGVHYLPLVCFPPPPVQHPNTHRLTPFPDNGVC